MTMVKFNGGIEISLKDLIWLMCIIGAIVASWYSLPQKIMAECESRYASRERVDALREDVSYIRARLDRLYELLQSRRLE